MIEAVFIILGPILTLIITVYERRTNKVAVKKREDEKFEKAMATDDFSYLSDNLSGGLDKLHENNIQRGSKR